jgi:hypothetical protein
MNQYANLIDPDLFDRTPKAVFAAMAVSGLSGGGDYLEGMDVDQAVLEEWDALYRSGIVPQRPPKPKH